ncbi:hypothetical protein RFI_03780 [Reticulomyxa filosa]|uniref:Uncharacterized protein n=1 Tax=Reticulomyxa filosa TaxID=46433 RepID=X6P6S8_RETFI|nr:hypothetical protein RFI_03780 [Reticulomyxa filosa]|eukprot:ETO33327.1 hypothetical protein RFI_03780 [Reticulomyxa filosa]
MEERLLKREKEKCNRITQVDMVIMNGDEGRETKKVCSWEGTNSNIKDLNNEWKWNKVLPLQNYPFELLQKDLLNIMNIENVTFEKEIALEYLEYFIREHVLRYDAWLFHRDHSHVEGRCHRFDDLTKFQKSIANWSFFLLCLQRQLYCSVNIFLQCDAAPLFFFSPFHATTTHATKFTAQICLELGMLGLYCIDPANVFGEHVSDAKVKKWKETEAVKIDKDKFVNIQRARLKRRQCLDLVLNSHKLGEMVFSLHSFVVLSLYSKLFLFDCLIVLELQVESYESGDWILFTHVIQKLLTL